MSSINSNRHSLEHFFESLFLYQYATKTVNFYTVVYTYLSLLRWTSLKMSKQQILPFSDKAHFLFIRMPVRSEESTLKYISNISNTYIMKYESLLSIKIDNID